MFCDELNLNNDIYTIENKSFEPYIDKNELKNIVNITANNIYNYYKNIVSEEEPLIIIGVLNGSFIFLADLVKKLKLKCEIHFIKVSSYEGTETTGKITNILGLTRDITNQHVLIVEDIIDTGLTIVNLIKEFKTHHPKNLHICTLLFKKEKYTENIPIDFIGKTIPDKFVIGYGLDYNHFGRNLDIIYKLIE